MNIIFQLLRYIAVFAISLCIGSFFDFGQIVGASLLMVIVIGVFGPDLTFALTRTVSPPADQEPSEDASFKTTTVCINNALIVIAGGLIAGANYQGIWYLPAIHIALSIVGMIVLISISQYEKLINDFSLASKLLLFSAVGLFLAYYATHNPILLTLSALSLLAAFFVSLCHTYERNDFPTYMTLMGLWFAGSLEPFQKFVLSQ